MTPRRKLLSNVFSFYLALTLLAMLLLLALTGAGFSLRNVMLVLVAALLTAGASFALVWKIRVSLEKTREGARRFAEGDLEFRLEVPQSEELGGLAETLNQMAAQLDERISTINQQRNEQDAILGSMVEGVIAVDSASSILQINHAAAQLVGTRPDSVIGRSLHEVIRNREIHQLIDRSLNEGKPTVGETLYHGASERLLQVHVSALRNMDGESIGALMVLNDITRLRRLEQVRRDFVANVSHELKTPLTSIKGFIETLMDGALDQPEEARRFCSIIAKQVDRLQAIIEDLLSLSRIEQEVEDGQLELKSVRLADVLSSAAQCVEIQAAEKNIRVEIDCAPSVMAAINPPLFEQVAVNLIDNAIKYSDPGKRVSIRVTPAESFWDVSFADQGHGIDADHLNRIFERFYRVDKARSRKVGGTGLGLAIVKHIVTAHGGRVRVESKPGQGSIFTVSIPRQPQHVVDYQPDSAHQAPSTGPSAA